MADHGAAAAGSRSTGVPAGSGDPLYGWVDAIDELWPSTDAEAWDQVGLQVGDPLADTVHGVLVTLDLTAAVLEEAAALGADLVLAHHPLLFRPLGRLTPATAAGSLALRAARQGCAVVAAHTNLDKAVDGTSHPAADALDLQRRRPLRPLPPDTGQRAVKVVTFVPQESTDAVVDALTAAGAGTIGDYTGCAYVGPGTGTYVPGPASTPAIGVVGRREHVGEHRLETVVRRAHLDDVLDALRRAHPYEEVPVDVYPLDPAGDGDAGRSEGLGLGLVGTLPQPLPLRQVATLLAQGLPAPHLRLAAPDPDALVSRVGICGGAGDDLLDDVLTPTGPSVDVFVTGDLKHHVVLDALAVGLPLIDAGHFATENPAMDVAATALADIRERRGLSAPVHRSTIRTDPWTDWKAIR